MHRQIHLKFLFQIGTIKRKRGRGFPVGLVRFYSKLVRLKGEISRMRAGVLVSRFYSKLVRLKVKQVDPTPDRCIRFYSKLVRLKESHHLNHSKHTASFYSKLVRLKVGCNVSIVSVYAVSIPNWYD